MAPHPKITAAFTAFSTFLDLSNYYKPLNRTETQSFKIHPKKFHSTIAFEMRTQRMCHLHHQPSRFYPAIFIDARAIHDILLNTQNTGTTITTDLLENRQDSDIHVAMTMRKMDYIRNIHELFELNGNQVYINGASSYLKILEQEDTMNGILQDRARLPITPDMYDELFNLANYVDQKKKGPDGIIELHHK